MEAGRKIDARTKTGKAPDEHTDLREPANQRLLTDVSRLRSFRCTTVPSIASRAEREATTRAAQRLDLGHQSNPGGAAAICLVRGNPRHRRLDCFASLAMTKKEGGTPADVSSNLRAIGRGARPAGRARLSAFHRGSCRWASRPAGATSGQASWVRGGTFDPVRPRQPGHGDLTLLNGRYPRPPVPVQGTHLPDRS